MDPQRERTDQARQRTRNRALGVIAVAAVLAVFTPGAVNFVFFGAPQDGAGTIQGVLGLVAGIVGVLGALTAILAALAGLRAFRTPGSAYSDEAEELLVDGEAELDTAVLMLTVAIVLVLAAAVLGGLVGLVARMAGGF